MLNRISMSGANTLDFDETLEIGCDWLPAQPCKREQRRRCVWSWHILWKDDRRRLYRQRYHSLRREEDPKQEEQADQSHRERDSSVDKRSITKFQNRSRVISSTRERLRWERERLECVTRVLKQRLFLSLDHLYRKFLVEVLNKSRHLIKSK